MNQKLLLLSGLFLSLNISLYSQTKLAPQIADQFIADKSNEWGLSATDIAEYRITDQYASKHNQVTHIYLQQMHQGIPVHGAYINLNIAEDGTVIFAGKPGFIGDLTAKVNASQASLEAPLAVVEAAKYFGFTNPKLPVLKRQDSTTKMTFEKTNFARNEIPVELVYQPMEDGTLKLAWDMSMDIVGSHDYWSVRVDAQNGKILEQSNWTVYCSFEEDHFSNLSDNCGLESSHQTMNVSPETLTPNFLAEGAQYRVYGWPAESPIHGDHVVLTDPHFPEASPFGWHDTDGEEGPEYTITRGNNVNAYIDKDDSFSPDQPQPDGGMELIFDFPHKTAEEPDSSLDADQTNLFYANNFIHDVTYLFGFDEEAGNFQQNNYENGGIGGDYVEARSLAGADNGTSNNATFGTPSDGGSGTMNMFLWTNQDDNLEILTPTSLSGNYQARPASDWGQSITNLSLEGKITIVNDGVGTRSDACSNIVNIIELDGNIALIDRGICEFGTKALNAEEAGAVAAIICNVPGVNGGNGEEMVTMGPGVDGNQVTIPALFMKYSDCAQIKLAIENGIDVNVNIQASEGPDGLSSAFDNGIMFHEYGHGISNRLVGGPANAGALGNNEQMGEGWSDFFSLVLTVEPGDLGTDSRGIGNFVLKAKPDSRGIRRFPYSTDMNVNPQTYDDIKGTTAPHDLGEVWNSCLWDMYWALVDKYGYDPDWRNTESGNFRAIQLVIDGMKFLNPSPGFIQGRDAILAADDINYNGENFCLIWSVFARRGVGWNADDGGTTTNRNDGTEGFETYPFCIKELKIDKQATDFIRPGEDVEITIKVSNHKEEAVDGVVVTDDVPDGFSYVEGSANWAVTKQGSTLIFDLGTMESLDEQEITFTLSSSADKGSESFFLDEFEDGGLSMFPLPLNGNALFNYVDVDANSPDFSWFVQNEEAENDQVLMMADFWDVTGENPVMRFYTKYDTEAGFDGGFVEATTDGDNWDILKNFVRGEYSNTIAYSTIAIPALEGYSGTTEDEWIASYIDLSAYKGQPTVFRFRFVSDDNAIGSGDFPGWFIDDLEFMDLDLSEGEACVTSDDNDMACASTVTIIDVKDETSTEEVFNYFSMDLFPNPAGDYVQLKLAAPEVTDAVLSISTLDGKEISKQKIRIDQQVSVKTIQTADYPSGIYLLQITSGKYISTEKLIIR